MPLFLGKRNDVHSSILDLLGLRATLCHVCGFLKKLFDVFSEGIPGTENGGSKVSLEFFVVFWPFSFYIVTVCKQPEFSGLP